MQIDGVDLLCVICASLLKKFNVVFLRKPRYITRWLVRSAFGWLRCSLAEVTASILNNGGFN